MSSSAWLRVIQQILASHSVHNLAWLKVSIQLGNSHHVDSGSYRGENHPEHDPGRCEKSCWLKVILRVH